TRLRLCSLQRVVLFTGDQGADHPTGVKRMVGHSPTMQTMEGTVTAQGRLVVVPIPDDVADADVLCAVHSFLVGHVGVPRCAAFVTWDEDGTLVAQDIEPDVGDASADSVRRPLRSALSALLVELFGAPL